MSSSSSDEKKHYWLVSYIAYDRGIEKHGFRYLLTDKYRVTSGDLEKVAKDIPNNHAFKCVSYLGEMTEKEWNE